MVNAVLFQFYIKNYNQKIDMLILHKVLLNS